MSVCIIILHVHVSECVCGKMASKEAEQVVSDVIIHITVYYIIL